jgi:hypothetical protein
MAEAARTRGRRNEGTVPVVVLSVVIGAASFSPAAAAAGGTSTASIVGRWQQSHTCDELVSALTRSVSARSPLAWSATNHHRQTTARGAGPPLEGSTARWMVAVSYPGTTWNRVACQGWC